MRPLPCGSELLTPAVSQRRCGRLTPSALRSFSFLLWAGTAIACGSSGSGSSSGTSGTVAGAGAASGAASSGTTGAVGAGAAASSGSGGTSGGATSGNGGASGGATSGSTSGGTGGSAAGSAVFTVDIALSSTIAKEMELEVPGIGTVGIVQWSIDAPIDSAYIDFGRDQNNFEYRAPVDLAEPGYRTLLLGMKPSTTYYAQIVAQAGVNTYTSDVYPVETDALLNGLPVFNVNDVDATALYAGGGFTVNCTGITAGGFGGGGGGRSFAFILDKDADLVWAYELTDTVTAGCSRARLSFDGKSMWSGNFSNVSPDGALMRVTLDGLGEPETYSLPGRNHDFAMLPNGHVLYFEQQNGGGYTNGSEGPDTIKELDPETGMTTELYDETRDFAAQIEESNGAHTNYVTYVPELDAISFSLRHSSTIGLISYPDAELLAVFGGPLSTFDISWNIQHGHHVLADHILIFNNEGTNGGSSILGYQFDIATSSATKYFDYSSGNSSGAFGDVKELPNGNLFVTYSTSGVLHEVNADGELLREITTSESLGYSEHLGALYGSPPPFDR